MLLATLWLNRMCLLAQDLDGMVWWHGITDHQNPSRRGVATTSVESAGLEPSSVDDLHIVSSKKRPPNTPQQKGRSHLEQQSNTDDTTPRKGKKKKKQKKTDEPTAASTAIATQCYFERQEARNLFATKSPDNMPVSAALQNRIDKLKECSSTSDGWRDIVEGGDLDNVLSNHQIDCVRERARFILAALLYAKQHMGKHRRRWTFQTCCQAAITDLNRLGMNTTTNAELSDEDLAKVNAYHKDKNSNLILYWCYEHMVLQLEDYIDILQALHGELYEYVFLFDHSCGHDRNELTGWMPD
jgi:hypothetical protein